MEGILLIVIILLLLERRPSSRRAGYRPDPPTNPTDFRTITPPSGGSNVVYKRSRK